MKWIYSYQKSYQKRVFKLLLFVGIGGVFLLPLFSQAVTIGPVKLEINADPGETLQGTTFLMNETKTAATYYPSFEGFTEVNGTKKFFSEKVDLASWFEIPQEVTLKSQEQKTIPYTLNVPKNAAPGGHFAVMWWSTGSPSQEKQVSIVTRAGILVYLRVSGEIKEEGEIQGFSVGKSRFIFHLPVTFNFIFKNTGNVYLKPKGKIEVKNILGRTRAVIDVNKKDLSILPNSEKILTAQWEPQGFILGPYKVNLNLTYGESKQTIEKNYWLFVLPIKPLIILVIILFLIFFGIPKGLKKYNQWIVDKHNLR